MEGISFCFHKNNMLSLSLKHKLKIMFFSFLKLKKLIFNFLIFQNKIIIKNINLFKSKKKMFAFRNLRAIFSHANLRIQPKFYFAETMNNPKFKSPKDYIKECSITFDVFF